MLAKLCRNWYKPSDILSQAISLHCVASLSTTQPIPKYKRGPMVLLSGRSDISREPSHFGATHTITASLDRDEYINIQYTSEQRAFPTCYASHHNLLNNVGFRAGHAFYSWRRGFASGAILSCFGWLGWANLLCLSVGATAVIAGTFPTPSAVLKAIEQNATQPFMGLPTCLSPNLSIRI